MTVFEFVVGLFSIVVSLAVAHLLTGVADLVRNRKRVKFSFVLALWMLSAFSLTVGNWAGIWAFRDMSSWPAWSILLMIMVVVGSYFVCYFVTPDAKGEGQIDMVDFQMGERGSYMSALIALGLLSLAANAIFGAVADFQAWMRDSMLAFVAMGFTLLSLLVQARWAQWTGAVFVAIIAVYFLAVSTNIATTPGNL